MRTFLVIYKQFYMTKLVRMKARDRAHLSERFKWALLDESTVISVTDEG